MVYAYSSSKKAMATHSSILAWKIPWMEKPGRLQFIGSRRVRHDWATSLYFSLSCIGERNGKPIRCSCLENPWDGGAWWAAIYGVTQSWTWLKWLSSRSSYSSWYRGPETSVISWVIRALGVCSNTCSLILVPDPEPPNLLDFPRWYEWLCSNEVTLGELLDSFWMGPERPHLKDQAMRWSLKLSVLPLSTSSREGREARSGVNSSPYLYDEVPI